MRRFSFSFMVRIALVVFLLAGIYWLLKTAPPPSQSRSETTSQSAAADSFDAATSSQATSTSIVRSATTSSATSSTKSSIAKKTSNKAIKSLSSSDATPAGAVERIASPYNDPPFSLSAVNQQARAALVNIICLTPGGSVRPISGSGVFIDPKGVILTNAHVAQYVLLSESANIDLQCFVRTGSPASSKWIPAVMYIPSAWIAAHAAEITQSHVLGTGEHDYALLTIAASVDDTPLPSSYPYLPVDLRDGIGFQGDSVIAASYPAEFLGGLAATNNLYAASSPTTIKDLLTFGTNSIDAIALNSVIEAQSGSSGGAIVNPWGYEIGLITTTSEGTTTADRTLRGITLSYINRDITAQSGNNLPAMLSGNVAARTDQFTADTAPGLVQLLIDAIHKNQTP